MNSLNRGFRGLLDGARAMWRTQLAQFQDPLLKEFKLACVSTQIWGMISSLHMKLKNDLKEMCNIPQI